ncbi:MAG: hypothetical protein HRU20_00245 [Pseudomonadales bacterium]|nr:hypothetical protein [Pseudomonadales bacterium]
MLLYEVPNIIKIFYEKENELIEHEWLEYNPEDQDDTILMILQEIYDIFLIYPVEKVIVKADQTKGAFSLGMQKYIRDVQFPRLLSDTKLRYVATIKSEDEMKGIGVKLWQAQFHQETEVVLHDVGSEEEAREWLKSIAK